MPEENLKIINRIYEAFNEGNYEAVLDHFGEHFEWFAADHSPLADRSPYRGQAEVRAGVFDRIAAGFEYLRVRRDEIFAAADRVVMLGYYDGVFKASGNHFEAQTAHVWTLENGRAVKFQQYVDTFQINESAKQTAR